ncbi:MAG: DUF1707 and DUF4190 domain-containing protein [Actinobacteria bacterium]|nr:DUF1707 and DUF4190 domain-containing protein [Actinomycetota bacterium]
MAVGPGYPAAGGRGQMRAADADRDRAVSFLSAAYTEGRLGKDEYDTRLETALSARTYADLDEVVSDLPGARVPPVRRVTTTNGLAVASLACGLAQFVFGPLPTIPAIVLGHVARHQIRRTGEQGAGMALAGLLLGWAAIALGIIAILGLAVFAATSSGHPTMAHLHHMGFPPPPPGP